MLSYLQYINENKYENREITYLEFCKLYDYNKIDLNTKDIETIKNYFKKYKNEIIHLSADSSMEIRKKNMIYSYAIIKLQDDWFVLECPGKTYDKSKFYKCDEMKGLLKQLDISFVNYNDIIKENAIYDNKEITFDDYCELLLNLKDISHKNVKHIQGYFLKYEFIETRYSILYYGESEIRFLEIIFNFKDAKYYVHPPTFIKNNYIAIFEIQDEWFVLQYNQRYFKCDELKGAFKQLDELINEERENL